MAENRFNYNMNNCNNGQTVCNDCRTLMNRLRYVDFALTETVLYLDAYPDSREALEFYGQLKEQREKLMAAYEGKCGPITSFGNESDTEWNWVDRPWPWEAEAN